MTFTVNSLTRCAGQGHWHIDLTVSAPAGAAGDYRITLTTAEVQDAIGTFAEARERIITRCRSRAKEQGAGTFAAVKTALEGQSFQV